MATRIDSRHGRLLAAAVALAMAAILAAHLAAQPPANIAPPGGGQRPAVAAGRGNGTLPNEHGQVWREYDISPYTAKVTDVPKPEQAIVDWILRETGTEMWFGEPLGILSATPKTLRVYHTPQVQQIAAEMVERFVNGDSSGQAIGLRLVTLDNPNWRSAAQRMLRPVNVQTPGVEAWLLSKEDAAVLLSEIRKRTDFREHSAPNMVIFNGQSQTLGRTRPLNYVKRVRQQADASVGYGLEMGQVEEGFTMQICPLLSLDGRTIDAVVKAEVNQLEKLEPVWIDVPTAAAPKQRVSIQVPQMSSWRLHERFRWPADQVLLISRGIVAAPAPGKTAPAGLPPLANGPARSNALLFLESKGKAATAAVAGGEQAGPRVGSLNFGGRY